MTQTLAAKVDEAVEQNAPENAHPSEWDLDEMLERSIESSRSSATVTVADLDEQGSRGDSPRCCNEQSARGLRGERGAR